MSGVEMTELHHVVPFRSERNATLDTLRWAKKRLTVPVLLEVDVTEARRAIQDARRETGSGLSFTAWVISCVARAAAEHPRIHAIRRGRRELVLFDEVDVAVLIERDLEGGDSGETLPMPAVVRRAEQRRAQEIHREIRNAQAAHVSQGSSSIGGPVPAWVQALFFNLPAWTRDLLFWRWLLRSPTRIKKTMGTVVVTATGMAARGVLSWGIPLSLHPLSVGVGGIARRSTPAGEREMLALTILFDHSVIDGAPVGRFVGRLHELMTGAHGLVVEAPAQEAGAASASAP